jgi:hypothetical protein
MKKIILLFILSLSISHSSSAQEIDWEFLMLDSAGKSFDAYSDAIRKIITHDDYIYVGFYSRGGGHFLPDTGNLGPYEYNREFIAKFDVDGNFHWSQSLDLFTNWDFDVVKNTVYITGMMDGDMRIGKDTIINTGIRQNILLALSDQGNLKWHKRAPHIYSSMFTTAIAVQNDKIAVAFENNSRRDMIRFDTQEATPLNNFYYNILQIYDTLGNFINYEAFNTLRQDNRESTINSIEKKNGNLVLKMGLAKRYSYSYSGDSLKTYSQIRVYNPDKKEWRHQLNFASHFSYRIQEVLPILDNRYLIAGLAYSPTLEIQEKFKLQCNSDKVTCKFIALVDEQGGPIWSIPIQSNRTLTDIAYDANRQEIYTSIVKAASTAEQDLTGKRFKNIITRYSRFGKIIDSTNIFLAKFTTDYGTSYGPQISVYESNLYYSNPMYAFVASSGAIISPSFNLAKIKFDQTVTSELANSLLYPNPVRNYFVLKNMDNKTTQLLIRNAQGQRVNNFSYEVKDNMIVVYTDELANGFYILSTNDFKTFKFIKQ